MITVNEKDYQRKIAKEIRLSLFANGQIHQKSSAIVSKILNSSDFQNAKNIALYYPLLGEIDLRGLLNYPNKNFYLPRCIGMDMEFVLYQGEDFLIDGDFKIKVPLGNAINPEILDIIYIPALMANNKNFRLGYGKGYYDRFLSKFALNSKKVIIVARELISSDFIESKFDYKCDGIISA